MFERLAVREKPSEKAQEPGEMYSVNTVKIYQTYMNKLSQATGIDTVEKLLSPANQRKAVKYLDSQTGDNWKHRVAYSAIFYSLGQRPKKDIKILFDGFQKWKKPE